MKTYRVLFRTRFRVLLQYRGAAVAGSVTQLFWGFIMLCVYRAFYASSDAVAPMPLPALVSYVWLGQMLFALLPWAHDREIEALVRRGDVAFELVRPVDLYGLWYARTCATRLSNASLRALPIVVVAGLLLPALGLEDWRLQPPASPASALAFAVSLAFSVLMGGALTTLVHVSLLFTISGEGISRLMPSLVTIFSGMVVPLPLLPDWAQPLLSALPFRALVDVPFRLWTGHLPPASAFGLVLHSALWSVLLVAAGRMLLRRATHRMVVQGG